MEEKPKFEICRSFGGDLCTTVDSLDYILTGTMYGDKLKLRKEDQDLVRAVLGRIRYDLNSCIIDFMEEERRDKINERRTEV